MVIGKRFAVDFSYGKETEKAVFAMTNKGQIWLPKSKILLDEQSKRVLAVDQFLNEVHELGGIEINDDLKEMIQVNELEVKTVISKSKSIEGVSVTYKPTGKTYKRRVYPRKTGKLKGSYLFNFKKYIYKFKKSEPNGTVIDLECIGSYETEGFEAALKSIENDETAVTVLEEEEIDLSQPVEHKEAKTIKICVENDIPVYLVGPAGSGKNHTLQQIAEDLDLDFYFTNSIQQEYKLTGFIDAGGVYHETEFYKAFKNGGLFFLDEMDASIPEVLVLLNAAIANRYFEFPNGKIEAHENFRVVAAGNTFGNGADEQYTGRLVLDQATLDRFTVINFDYDKDIELFIAKGNRKLVDFIDELRNQCIEKGIRGTFSYRSITNISKLESALPLQKIMEIAVFKGMDKDTLNTIDIPVVIELNNYYWAQAKRYIKQLK